MRKKGFTSVVVILVAVIVLLAGVVVWQSFSQSDTIEPQNSPSPVAVSIPSDWETYAGSGYSFSYPSDFEQQPYVEGNFKGVSVVGYGPVQKASGRTQTSLFDGLLIKTIVITGADKFVQEVAQDSYQADNDSLDPISVEEGTQDISELVPVTVGGAAGYSYELKSSFSNTKVAFLPLNNGVLKITFFRAGEEPALTGYINQGDQILSTFKLTKNESPKTVALPTPPSTWKSHIF